jgi:uncharacterized Zn-finger protein
MARKTKTAPAAAAVTDIGAFPPPETIVVHSHRVACEGVGGALGHPRVWIELGVDGAAECGYCDRRFVLAHDHVHDSEHAAPGVYQGPSGH